MFKIVARFLKRNQKLFGWPFVLVMALVALGIALVEPLPLEQVELNTLDVRFRVRGPVKPNLPVVIVAVDNASLEQVGRWPWSRDLIGLMIERIMGDYHAKTIGFDIVFSEEQANPFKEAERLLALAKISDGALEAALNRHRELGDIDAHFEKLLSQWRTQLVPGYFFYPTVQDATPLALKKAQEDADNMMDSALTTEASPQGLKQVTQIAAINTNLPRFIYATESTGFFNFLPDSDGIVRRVPLIGVMQGLVYPSLDIQTLRIAKDWPDVAVDISDNGVESFSFASRKIHVDNTGQMLLNHYGPGQTFKHVSALDVLSGKADPEIFRDAIVFMGVTATGVYDYRATPFDPVFPGVEAHAVAVGNILDGRELDRPQWLGYSELASVLIFSLLFGLLSLRSGPVVQSAIIFGMPLLIFMIGQWLFGSYNIWMKQTYLILAVLLTVVPRAVIQYWIESYDRANIRDAFSHYLAPKVVEQLEMNPESLKLGGEERVMTAMFSDIASFSTFSERLSPTELVRFLNKYLGAMSNIIMDHGGTIDKYEGDAIIAFFGAPLVQPDHAVRAVRSVLDQLAALDKLREQWIDEGYPAVYVRFGINSGAMVVGNMGSETKFDYTIMGDNVNLASRLEGVNKVYGSPLLISHDTWQMVCDEIECRFIDRVRVVGRRTPVDLYLPLGMKGEVSADILEFSRCYQEAWNMMQERRFAEARLAFAAVASEHQGDGPSVVMMVRATSFMNNPPPESWDGVHNLTEK